MKKFFCLLLILFFAFEAKVYAKNETLKCEYEVIYTAAIENNPENKSFVKLLGTFYDDGSSNLQYASYGDIYNDLKMDGRNYITNLSLYDWKGRWKQDLSMGAEIYTSGFQITNGSCPIAISEHNNSTFIISFSDTLSCDNQSTFCSTATETIINKPKDDDKKIELTSSCVKSVVTDQFSGRDQGVEFKFNMYSDGSKEFCGRIKNSNSFVCTAKIKGEEVMSIQMFDSNTLNGVKTFYINKDDVSTFFQQNFHQLDNNSFSCPNKMYLIYESVNEQLFKLTTSSDEASGWGDKSIEVKNGDLESNGDHDTTDPGHLSDPNGGVDIGNFEGCSILGSKSELRSWLISLLNLIKVAAIIFTIILSIIDAIKSLSSFKDEQNKKFYKNLMNRLICCALLFLIPSIIKLLLYIFSANSNISDVLEKPFCGLL